MPVSPYDVPGFYDRALAEGRHRDIVGGRWEETGRAQMEILTRAGLQPHHHVLDIGAGPLRLGCRLVPFLESGHYWATDQSRALMMQGRAAEVADPARLPTSHLIEDARFDFPKIPPVITHAIAFAVFTHLPQPYLRRALTNLHSRFPHLELALFTVFLAPDAVSATKPFRQRDGVVTHDLKAPYHMLAGEVLQAGRDCGWTIDLDPVALPRGQALFHARPVRQTES